MTTLDIGWPVPNMNQTAAGCAFHAIRPRIRCRAPHAENAAAAQGLFSPIVEALLNAGVPRSVTALTYLVIAILGRTTFLLPGVMVGLLTRTSAVTATRARCSAG